MLDVNVLRVMDAHRGGVAAVAFHSNGTQALSGGADKMVKLWDLTTGQVLKTFGPLPDAVRAVISQQAHRTLRRAAADAVICNEGLGLAELSAHVEGLWERWTVASAR